MSTISYPHLEIDRNGVAMISGTTTKVVEIVQDHIAHRWDAEEIHRQYPYLGLAQIHAALTYYYDHKQEMDQDIEARLRNVANIRAQRGDRATHDKLRRLGHLP